MSKKCDNSIRCSYCRTNFIFPVRFRRIGIEHDRPCSGYKGEGAAAEQGKCRIGNFHHRSGVRGTAYGGWCCLGGRFIVTKPIHDSLIKRNRPVLTRELVGFYVKLLYFTHCYFRQSHKHNCSVFGAFFCFYCPTVERSDFPNQRKSKSYAAVRSAAGLVHAEKRLKDAFSILFGNSKSVILYSYENPVCFITDGNMNRCITAIISYGIFG